jgi:hypothetical protein
MMPSTPPPTPTRCSPSPEIVNPNRDAIEPLLNASANRYTLLPIMYPDIFSVYKKMVSSFWVVEGKFTGYVHKRIA